MALDRPADPQREPIRAAGRSWGAVRQRDSGNCLAVTAGPAYRRSVRIDISEAAVQYVVANGGQVWVWAARPRMCCSGAPALMHAATTAPARLSGFTQIAAEATTGGLAVYFRTLGGMQPDVLEIAMEGRRRPKVAAYWDGCLMAMTG